MPESALSPGETNVLRLRAEGEPGTGYSVPVSLLYDPSVTPSSPNQIRSLGVSRSGTDLVLRWALLTENGKQTKVSFRRADTGATYVLTPQALASSIKSYTLSSQALASPCGDFLLSQVLQTNETGATPPLRNPSSQSGTQGTEIDPCDDPPPDPAPGPRFTNAYHHRDHLGTLRNVTGDGGYLAAACDWYPYGTRMRTGLADSASDSRRVFTGHERDLATGLDYMLARYYSPMRGTFLSTDPAMSSARSTSPGTWNRYAYAGRAPVRYTDPTGLDYFDQRGNRIGSTSDGRHYLVVAKSDVKAIKKSKAEVSPADVKSAIRLPGPNVLTAMNRSVERMKAPTADDTKGHFHEEGGVSGPNAAGEEVASPANPGPVADPTVDSHATINVYDFADMGLYAAIKTPSGEWHVHPDGTVTVGPGPATAGTTTLGRVDVVGFRSEPSSQDFDSCPGTCYVLSPRNNTAYVHDNQKGPGQMPLSTLLGLR